MTDFYQNSQSYRNQAPPAAATQQRQRAHYPAVLQELHGIGSFTISDRGRSPSHQGRPANILMPPNVNTGGHGNRGSPSMDRGPRLESLVSRFNDDIRSKSTLPEHSSIATSTISSFSKSSDLLFDLSRLNNTTSFRPSNPKDFSGVRNKDTISKDNTSGDEAKDRALLMYIGLKICKTHENARAEEDFRPSSASSMSSGSSYFTDESWSPHSVQPPPPPGMTMPPPPPPGMTMPPPSPPGMTISTSDFRVAGPDQFEQPILVHRDRMGNIITPPGPPPPREPSHSRAQVPPPMARGPPRPLMSPSQSDRYFRGTPPGMASFDWGDEDAAGDYTTKGEVEGEAAEKKPFYPFSPRYTSDGLYSTNAATLNMSTPQSSLEQSFSGTMRPSGEPRSSYPPYRAPDSHWGSDEDEYVEVNGITYVIPARSKSKRHSRQDDRHYYSGYEESSRLQASDNNSFETGRYYSTPNKEIAVQSTRKPRPTKLDKLLLQHLVTNVEDLPEHVKAKGLSLMRKRQNAEMAAQAHQQGS